MLFLNVFLYYLKVVWLFILSYLEIRSDYLNELYRFIYIGNSDI